MVPWAHPNPQPEQHLNRFSRFCTAHGRASIYFTMSHYSPPPQNCPFPCGDQDSYLIHHSFGTSEHTTQTASSLVQQFLHILLQSFPIVYNGPPLPPWKLSLPVGDVDPYLIMEWFPGPTQVLNSNSISISSAVFAGLTTVTDRLTDSRYVT